MRSARGTVEVAAAAGSPHAAAHEPYSTAQLHAGSWGSLGFDIDMCIVSPYDERQMGKPLPMLSPTHQTTYTPAIGTLYTLFCLHMEHLYDSGTALGHCE